MEFTKLQRQFGGKTLSIETGKIAKQADGSVIVSMGETMVLVTACRSAPRSEEIDFFPLSVDYREKLSAAGKFPGGFMKREGRPSTKEILTSRMIDRPIRPLFPEGYFDEVQVLVSVISADQENDPDVLAMIGASAALSISSVPFQGPLGACRLSIIDGEYEFFPSHEQRENSDFNLILAGRKEAINMIEVDAREIPEDKTADAIQKAHEVVGQVADLISELQAKVGKDKEFSVVEAESEVVSRVTELVGDKFLNAYQIKDKLARGQAISEIKDPIREEFCTADESGSQKCTRVQLGLIFEKLESQAVRKLILDGQRPDGRGDEDLRNIECEVGILPRAHGSALFTRGETQSLVSLTLGTGRDEQIVDGLLEEYGQKFMLHYNFPPSSVGEVRPMRGPGRREIGHGALAEKALEQIRPDAKDFAYTIKINSDITESNGSSSMASICGGTLAMMDAGVPVKQPVAGISIGLVVDDTDSGNYRLLTDIIGDEDHFGDMDFKIAGSKEGITAIQLDIKATGLPHDIMVEALERAKQARHKILDIMLKAIEQPREQLSSYAPKMISVKIDPEQIGKIIGPGGKMIKGIQEDTDTVIEIEEDGTVMISCVGGNGHLKAAEIIESMTTPPKVGKIYENSKVVSVKDFGAFVEISPGVEGLCHISELSEDYVKEIDKVCKVGDVIPVKLLSIDEQGRFKLSRKAALKEMQSEEQEVTAEE